LMASTWPLIRRTRESIFTLFFVVWDNFVLHWK
jgi:hypothetical protein